MSDAIVGTVNSVADATGLPVAAVILIAVVVVFAVLVQICRAPRSASTDANDAPELEAIGENERRVDSIRVRAGRYVAAPPTADEVELLERPRKPKKKDVLLGDGQQRRWSLRLAQILRTDQERAPAGGTR